MPTLRATAPAARSRERCGASCPSESRSSTTYRDSRIAWCLGSSHGRLQQFVSSPSPGRASSGSRCATTRAHSRRAPRSPRSVSKRRALCSTSSFAPCFRQLAQLRRRSSCPGRRCCSRCPSPACWDRQSGRYLVEDHLLALAPSGTVFVRASAAAAASGARTTRLLAVGNPELDREQSKSLPTLPGAEAEADGRSPGSTRSSKLLTGSRGHEARLSRGPAATARSCTSRGTPTIGVAHGDGASAVSPRIVDTRGSGTLYAAGDRSPGPALRRVLSCWPRCRTAAGTTSRLEGTLERRAAIPGGGSADRSSPACGTSTTR